MNRLAAVLTLVVLSSNSAPAVAQDVYTDTTYQSTFWEVTDTAYFGASLFVEQRTSGGNPGAYRYMRHELPAPPGPQDLTSVEASHIDLRSAQLIFDPVVRIDYEEDVRLLSVPWQDAFIRSYPLIREDGRLFRASSYIQAHGDTNWVNGRLEGLTPEDFTALDGSGDHPVLDGETGFVYFGFWRGSSRLTSLPPIPPDQVLVYEHASDNFRITIYEQQDPPVNRSPIANPDDFLYLDLLTNPSRGYPVLENDSDPDGDTLRITSVSEPFGGEIVAFDDVSITYRRVDPVRDDDVELFSYDVTDGSNFATGLVAIHFCYCPIDCLAEFLQSSAPASGGSAAPSGKNALRGAVAAEDSLEVSLYRRFRDEVLLESDRGEGLVDAYYRLAPEVMTTLILERPNVGLQAVGTLLTMQSILRDVLDGNDPVVTQELVDDLEAFAAALLAVASDTLRAFIEGEMARVGPLQDLVGMPVAEVLTEVVGVSIEPPPGQVPRPTVAELRQNYPNPFGDQTTIEYYLPAPGPVEIVVYDMAGRRMTVLDGGLQAAGLHAVIWNGRDARGRLLADGVYFYEIRSGRTKDVRKMVLMR